MNIYFDRLWLYVDPRQQAVHFLSEFQTVDSRFFKIRLVKRYRQYQLAVDLISFDSRINVYSALQHIADMKNRRFLTPFELLALDGQERKMQFCHPVLIDQFALGVSQCKAAPRRAYGRVLSSIEEFEDTNMHPFTRIATAPFAVEDPALYAENAQSKTLRLTA